MEQDKICQILSDIKIAQNNSLNSLTVSITTNATVRFTDRLVSLLQDCAKITLLLSVDGFGIHNDYQRTGSNWGDIAENLIYFDNIKFAKDMYCFIDPTISLLTVNSIPDLDQWVSKNLHNTGLEGRTLSSPAELCIRNLPQDYKKTLADRFSDWTPTNQWINGRVSKKLIFSDLACEPNTSIDKIRERISVLDKQRNEDFAKVDPEMYAAIFQ